MLAYDPTKAQAKTGASVKGSQLTPVVGSVVSTHVSSAGKASAHSLSVKVGSGSHVAHNLMAAHTAEHFPAMTHGYGSGAINKIHARGGK